jgi:hypothetical protein
MRVPQMVIFKYLEEKDVFQTFYSTKTLQASYSWCICIGQSRVKHDLQAERGLRFRIHEQAPAHVHTFTGNIPLH